MTTTPTDQPRHPPSTFDASVKIDWPQLFAKVPHDYDKAENVCFTCDDAGGILRMIVGPDGDIHMGVDPHPHASEVGHHGAPTIRVRTHQGGGRSSRVRKAALLLMLAIIEDEAENGSNPRKFHAV